MDSEERHGGGTRESSPSFEHLSAFAGHADDGDSRSSHSDFMLYHLHFRRHVSQLRSSALALSDRFVDFGTLAALVGFPLCFVWQLFAARRLTPSTVAGAVVSPIVIWCVYGAAMAHMAARQRACEARTFAEALLECRSDPASWARVEVPEEHEVKMVQRQSSMAYFCMVRWFSHHHYGYTVDQSVYDAERRARSSQRSGG